MCCRSPSCKISCTWCSHQSTSSQLPSKKFYSNLKALQTTYSGITVQQGRCSSDVSNLSGTVQVSSHKVFCVHLWRRKSLYENLRGTRLSSIGPVVSPVTLSLIIFIHYYSTVYGFKYPSTRDYQRLQIHVVIETPSQHFPGLASLKIPYGRKISTLCGSDTRPVHSIYTRGFELRTIPQVTTHNWSNQFPLTGTCSVMAKAL